MKNIQFISALLVTGTIITSCGGGAATSADAVLADAASILPVKVMSLEKATISRTIDYTSTILAYEELQVAPASPGRIDAIYVEVGDRVNKGDQLFLMDRTTLNQQKVQLASLTTDLARLETLLASGSVMQQQYDQMKVQYDVAKSNVEYMEQNTLMEAPFNAIVTGRYYENGELYSGSPSAASGGKAAIVTLMQVDPVKVKVGISEQYLPLVKKGLRAQLTSDVYSGQTFEGNVSLIYPTVDAATRTFQIEIDVPNKSGLLRPGMFVRVSMDLGTEEAYAVPSNTLMLQEGTNTRYVFVENNGVATRINVTVGKRYDDMVEISSPELKEGDRIISEGQARLVTGDKVRVTL